MWQLTYIIPVINTMIFFLMSLLITPTIAMPISFIPFLQGDIFDGPPGVCVPGSGNYTNQTSFKMNLSTVFFDLTAAAAASKSFSSATAGSGHSNSKVYASFYCHQDTSPRDCLTCVKNATTMLPDKCTRKEAIVYAGDCRVRYSNNPVFTKDDTATLLSCNKEGPKMPDPESFNKTVVSMLERLVDRVSVSGDREGSSVEALDWVVDQKVYAAVWCLPTGVVSRSECQDCLSRAVNETLSCLSKGATRGVNGRPNCWLRYDLQPFGDFISSPVPVPAPAPAPTAAVSTPSSLPTSSSSISHSPGNRSLFCIIAAAIILVKNFVDT